MIGLIVLMIALAVPTFNFISGNRSVEGAQNTIAAFLGRARAEAIGLQETRGVFFFIEKKSGRTAMALVRETQRPPNSGLIIPQVDVFLDLVPEAEFVTLPSGVGVQTIDDHLIHPGNKRRNDDGYIGYNNFNRHDDSQPRTHTLYGGVILFDGQGRLAARTYSFKTFIGAPPQATQMGNLLYTPSGDPTPLTNHYQNVPDVVLEVAPATSSGFSGNNYPPRSQFGVVLFDLERYRTAVPVLNFYEREWDWQFRALGTEYQSTPEEAEEMWLDDNAVPLLVNRYNGTLVKAQ